MHMAQRCVYACLRVHQELPEASRSGDGPSRERAIAPYNSEPLQGTDPFIIFFGFRLWNAFWGVMHFTTACKRKKFVVSKKVPLLQSNLLSFHTKWTASFHPVPDNDSSSHFYGLV